MVHQGNCLDCAFWQPGETHDTRGWCCQVWYWVQLNCGTAIGDVEPSEDGKICDKFQQGNGTPCTCYDCIHWDHERSNAPRDLGCKNWRIVHADITAFRKELIAKLGSNVEFTVFSSDYPDEDKAICLDFKLNPNRPEKTLDPEIYTRAQPEKFRKRRPKG